MEQIDILKISIENKQFHHATYRNKNTLWEGLWFYSKDEKGFRGYLVAGCINKNDPNLELAYELVKNTGISFGNFGNE
jgi:hypothetical protein